MPISLSEYLGMKARLSNRFAKAPPFPPPSPACSSESELHDQISSECKRRGWYVVHSRLDRPTTTDIGCPDFIIAAQDGRTFWIECKTAKGKTKPAQAAVGLMLAHLGHRYALVRSFEEFLEKVKI